MFCCHGSFVSLFLIFSSCLHSLSVQVWHLHRLYICLHAVCGLRMTWGTSPTYFYYPNNFHVCWLLLLQMKETQRDQLGVWDQSAAKVCFSFDLEMIQVCLLSSFSSFFLFDRLVSLYFYSISPPLSLISYLYWSRSFTSLWLSFFILLLHVFSF